MGGWAESRFSFWRPQALLRPWDGRACPPARCRRPLSLGHQSVAQEEPLVPGLSLAPGGQPHFGVTQQPGAHPGFGPVASPTPSARESWGSCHCRTEVRAKASRPWDLSTACQPCTGSPNSEELKEQGGQASGWPPALGTGPSHCLDKLSRAQAADGRRGSGGRQLCQGGGRTRAQEPIHWQPRGPGLPAIQLPHPQTTSGGLPGAWQGSDRPSGRRPLSRLHSRPQLTRGKTHLRTGLLRAGAAAATKHGQGCGATHPPPLGPYRLHGMQRLRQAAAERGWRPRGAGGRAGWACPSGPCYAPDPTTCPHSSPAAPRAEGEVQPRPCC